MTGVQEEEQNEKKELGSDATNNHKATPSHIETPPVAKEKMRDHDCLQKYGFRREIQRFE